jgi:dihydrofolate reductase
MTVFADSGLSDCRSSAWSIVMVVGRASVSMSRDGRTFLMSKIYVANHVSLDGVMQGPGRADEDTRDGFTHGGWAIPRSDEEVATTIQDRVAEAGGMRLLLGHRSYQDMLGYWNTQDSPFKDGLNSAQKYVVSRSASTVLPWPNSTLVHGEVSEQISQLKDADGPDLCIMGSGELSQLLLENGLIDELLLFIHPLILGTGRRFFSARGLTRDLELLASSVTTTGVNIVHYQLA